MAVLNVPTTHQAGKQRPGVDAHVAKLGVMHLTFDFDSSYPTGGEACDIAADARFVNTIKGIESVIAAPKGGAVFEWVASTKKLKAYWCAGAGAVMAEVSNTTDLSAITGVDLIVWYRG